MERRKSEETEKEPQAPVQGASGAGGSEGREDTGGVVVAVRRAPEPDHAMEESAPGASGVGIQRGRSRTEEPVDLKALHAKIGELALENDFLESALIKAGLLSAKR